MREIGIFVITQQCTMYGKQANSYPMLTNQLTDPPGELQYSNILRWKTFSAGIIRGIVSRVLWPEKLCNHYPRVLLLHSIWQTNQTFRYLISSSFHNYLSGFCLIWLLSETETTKFKTLLPNRRILILHFQPIRHSAVHESEKRQILSGWFIRIIQILICILSGIQFL